MKEKKEFAEIPKMREKRKAWTLENVNTCISCGAVIPEGMLVCMNCENGQTVSRCVVCGGALTNHESVCPRCRAMLLNSKNKDQK